MRILYKATFVQNTTDNQPLGSVLIAGDNDQIPEGYQILLRINDGNGLIFLEGTQPLHVIDQGGVIGPGWNSPESRQRLYEQQYSEPSEEQYNARTSARMAQALYPNKTFEISEPNEIPDTDGYEEQNTLGRVIE
jgi:hypothetical protein